jgi:ribonuclease P protein component
MGERLFRNQRIRLSGEFLRFRSGDAHEVHTPLLILKVLDVNLGVSRLGIIVTKKVGNAATRNSVRRVVREIFRKRLQKLGKNCDYLIIAKRLVAGISHEKVESELLNAASIAHGEMVRSGA